MKPKDEAVFLQLLVSHICHELVSPVGAIGNGVELLEEMDALDPEALGLISQSCRTAAAKLRLMRVVYGSAGMSQDFHLADAKRALSDLYAIESKLSLDWSDNGVLELAKGGVQLVGAIVLLAGSCLPRGGMIAVNLAAGAKNATLSVKATGVGPRFPDTLSLALRGQGEADHKTIHAHFCAWSAAHLGTSITAEASADAVSISALLPFPIEG